MATRARATTRKKSETRNQASKKRTTALRSLPTDQLLAFQRTIGNQAVQRLLKSPEMQARLAPSMVVQRTPDPVDISHPVRLTAQPTTNTCWAASLAMMLQYSGEQMAGVTMSERQYEEAILEHRSGREPLYSQRGISPADVARRAGPAVEAAYASNATVPHAAYSQIVSQLPMQVETQDFLSTQRQQMLDYLRGMLEQHGPIAVRIRPQGFDHLIVLTGLRGDGTPANTTAFYNDPWPVGRGEYAARSFNSVGWLPGMVLIRLS